MESETPRPKLIGITGNIACGKTTLGKLLEEMGYKVIDSDDIVSELYKNDEEMKSEILDLLGTLDKQEIASKIFGPDKKSQELKSELEKIIHPRVEQKLKKWISNHPDESLLFNLVPQLFEAGLESRFHKIILITAPREIQIERLKTRHPDWSCEEIIRRIDAQIDQGTKAKRADLVIENTNSKELLKESLKILCDL
jgi:dephospho-CoA kinase